MSEQAAAELDTDGHIFAAVEPYVPGGIVTRYLVVAEVITAEGRKVCATIEDDNAAPWDVYALARMAMAKADALVARQDAAQGDDDDEL